MTNKKLNIVEASYTFAGKDPRSFKSPKGGTADMLIITAQGSEYLITSDGMVLRNKSFHANTGGADAGLKSWSDKIEYFDPSEKIGGTTFPLATGMAVSKGIAVALSTTQDNRRALVILDNGKWRVAKISDIFKNVASVDAPIVSKYSTVPKLNWHVMDYNLNANGTLKSVHPGSPVTHGAKINESATAGSTSSGNIATVIPFNKTMIRRGPGGAPIAAQHKNKDGTVKNALDINGNIFGDKSMTQKRKKTNEALSELASTTDLDHEVQMARAELYKTAEYAIKLHNLLKHVSEEEGLEAWVQSKITKAAEFLDTVYHHIEYQKIEAQQTSPIRMPAPEGVDPYKDTLKAKLEEKAKSKSQQRFMGMVHAAQKGEKPASKEVAKVAKGISKKSAKDYASTKHKGLPNRVKKDK